jgi:chemotaxis signal transduction protein
LSRDEADLSARALELREAFDRSFGEAPSTTGVELEDLLALRLGSEPHAFALRDCAGLFRDKPVTPLPRSLPGLLGIAGFRGTIVPVYDLASALGQPEAVGGRWLLLVRGASLALAFDAFDGFVRVERAAISTPEPGQVGRAVVRTGVVVRAIIDLDSILDTITRRARLASPPKEL